MENLKKQIEELNLLKTDEERLLFCQKYNENFGIDLDNDASQIVLIQNNLDDDVYEDLIETMDWDACSFDEDFGDRSGVFNLMKMLQITCNYV